MFKRQTDSKTCRLTASFPLSASHSLFSVIFLHNQSDYTKTGVKSQEPFLELVSNENWQKKGYLHFSVCMTAIFEGSIL